MEHLPSHNHCPALWKVGRGYRYLGAPTAQFPPLRYADNAVLVSEDHNQLLEMASHLESFVQSLGQEFGQSSLQVVGSSVARSLRADDTPFVLPYGMSAQIVESVISSAWTLLSLLRRTRLKPIGGGYALQASGRTHEYCAMFVGR